MILGIDASRANVKEKTGVEWYAWRIIQELKKIIPDSVHVILYSREPLEGALSDLPEHWESRIIKTPFNRLWTHIGLSWEMLRRKPDILFVPAHVMPLVHPKSVITLHDVASERHPGSYGFFDRWYHRFTTRFAIERAHTIITPSRFTAQEICEIFGTPDCSIEVIHLGADTSDDRSEGGDPTIPLPKDPFIIHVGRLERKKGTHDLIRAFEIVKEDPAHAQLRLILVGRAGVGHKELDTIIASCAYRDHIVRLGWIPEIDKQHLLSHAHLFVFPSQYEGFGIPLLEAASCGVPVVARRTGSLPEISGHQLVRWFDQPYQLATVLKESLRDTQWHMHVRQEGPKHATRFSWRASALQTCDVLKRALDQSRSV